MNCRSDPITCGFHVIVAINVAAFNIGDATIDINRSCRNIRSEILNAIQRNAAITVERSFKYYGRFYKQRKYRKK